MLIKIKLRLKKFLNFIKIIFLIVRLLEMSVNNIVNSLIFN